MLSWKKTKVKYEAGTDEAGRGCLAGPVVAAAVILGRKGSITGLNDSKKLSESKRNLLRWEIEKKALCWAVGIVSHERIDEINILNASIEAMQVSLRQLEIQPMHILVDGNKFKEYDAIPFSCEVKGDARFASIAAASILAKTHRDEIMKKLSVEFPEYKWEKNKGYPSPEHIEAYKKFGLSKYHRKSFHLKSAQLELPL